MGIRTFFQKVGRGIGKFGGKVMNGVRAVGSVVKKAAGVVGKVAKPILGVLSTLPGKVGLIGKAGTLAAGAAEKLIDAIPSKEARDKLNGYVDKGRGLVNKVEDKARDAANKVAPWAQFGQKLINNRGILPAVISPKPSPA